MQNDMIKAYSYSCSLLNDITICNCKNMRRGGGLVVSFLSYDSDDPSSNLTLVYNYCVNCCLKSTKLNQSGRDGPIEENAAISVIGLRCVAQVCGCHTGRG